MEVNRRISLPDYFTQLQLEYISYKLRSLIYKRDLDISKFCSICKGKKEKIEQIAYRNKLPSIFSSESQKEKYLKRFFGDGGFPDFKYRDEYQEKVKGKWDKLYFFVEGGKVFHKGEEGFFVINSTNYVQNFLTLGKCDGGEMIANFDEVKRIFSEDFFKKLFN